MLRSTTVIVVAVPEESRQGRGPPALGIQVRIFWVSGLSSYLAYGCANMLEPAPAFQQHPVGQDR